MNVNSRRKRGEGYVTLPISFPRNVAEALTRRARKRRDTNRSAEATEIIARHYGIEVAIPVNPGGEPEKQQAPA